MTKDKGETAAAVIPDPPTSPPSTSSSPTVCKQELSCVAISNMDSDDELACLSTHVFVTILDSGATSHLVKDKGYFLSFAHEDRPPVKTANHRSLITTGRGTYIAEITLGETAYRIMLSDCLHAPGAMLNLFSIGQMLQKGWDCDFKGSNTVSGPHCRLSYKGEFLGKTLLTGNICYLNVHFLHRDELNSKTNLYKELCMATSEELATYTKAPVSWDTWHTHMGHPGGESVK